MPCPGQQVLPRTQAHRACCTAGQGPHHGLLAHSDRPPGAAMEGVAPPRPGPTLPGTGHSCEEARCQRTGPSREGGTERKGEGVTHHTTVILGTESCVCGHGRRGRCLLTCLSRAPSRPQDEAPAVTTDRGPGRLALPSEPNPRSRAAHRQGLAAEFKVECPEFKACSLAFAGPSASQVASPLLAACRTGHAVPAIPLARLSHPQGTV